MNTAIQTAYDLKSQPGFYSQVVASHVNHNAIYTPHAIQREIHEDITRFKVIVAGRRWGKSLLASVEAESMLLVPGSRGWIVSKTYDLTEKVFRYIKATFIQKWHVKPKHLRDSAPYYLELPWGAVVEGKTADNPDSLVGEGLDWLVFDECAACKQVIWEQYLRPTLTDREGRALFITTPRGYNWLFDLYKRGRSSEFPEWKSWWSPSWHNPYLSQADIDEARMTLSPMIFDQEYGASFQSNVGSVYPDFDILSHGISKPEIDLRWRHFRSIDFGYENPFVCLWIAVDPLDKVIIYDEYYRSHVTVEQAAADILAKEQEHAKAWKISSEKMVGDKYQDAVNYEWTICDPSAASARATLLEKGINTVAPASEVLRGIELVRQQLKYRDDGKTGLIVDIDKCPNTVKEFQLYSYAEPKSTNSNEAPVKENDHSLDCVRMLIMRLKKGYVRQSTAVF